MNKVIWKAYWLWFASFWDMRLCRLACTYHLSGGCCLHTTLRTEAVFFCKPLLNIYHYTRPHSQNMEILFSINLRDSNPASVINVVIVVATTTIIIIITIIIVIIIIVVILVDSILQTSGNETPLRLQHWSAFQDNQPTSKFETKFGWFLQVGSVQQIKELLIWKEI